MEAAAHGVHDVWPAGQEHLKPVITTCYLTSIAILSALLSRRWISWGQMKRLPIAKLLVLAVLADSLLFVFASAILILGVGTSFSTVACSFGIWLCIILYASSKVLIYSFLSEKLYAVYSVTPTRRVPRWQSTQYKIAMGFLVGWLVVAIVMIVGRISEIRRHDNACVIGLKLYATVPMLTVDAVVNIYLTAAFVIPVYRSRWHKAQKLALQSCVAAIASLITSFANIAVLTFEHGHQLSWVCLGSCGLDVCLNAIILYIVTASSTSSQNSAAEEYTVGNNAHGHHKPNMSGGGAIGTMTGVGSLSMTERHQRNGQRRDSFDGVTSLDKGDGFFLSATRLSLQQRSGAESDVTLEWKRSSLDDSRAQIEGEREQSPTTRSRPSLSSLFVPSAPASPRIAPAGPPAGMSVTSGVLVSEEVVTVAEVGLSLDEQREELEWLKRGRQSRRPSANATGNIDPSASSLSTNDLETLPRVDY